MYSGDEFYPDEITSGVSDDDLDDYGELTPLARSRLDPGGVYNSGGECIGRIPCGHEDYPCCGC
jgi:hypothetical protein